MVSAAKRISGKSIKSKSITGSKLKNNTITGNQVNESELGKVPSASKADSATAASTATNATNATSATNATTANNLTPLKPGESQSGFFSAADSDASGSGGGFLGWGITFERPLSAPIPNANLVDTHGADSAPHCPGVGQADPGYLCLYNKIENNTNHAFMYSDDEGYFSSPSKGVVVYWDTTGDTAYVGGEWTVTAP